MRLKGSLAAVMLTAVLAVLVPAGGGWGEDLVGKGGDDALFGGGDWLGAATASLSMWQ